MPTLADVLTRHVLPGSVPVSLDIKSVDAFEPTLEVIAAIAPELGQSMWLCHHDVRILEQVRDLASSVRLVDSTRLDRISEGPERRAARLAESNIDGINMHRQDWNGGLVTLFHRFGLTAFSWDAQHDHHLRPALRMGIDAVYSDHVDRMVDAARSESMI